MILTDSHVICIAHADFTMYTEHLTPNVSADTVLTYKDKIVFFQFKIFDGMTSFKRTKEIARNPTVLRNAGNAPTYKV